MGSCEFACAALQELKNNTCYNIVCVYTKPPKPANRGKKITKTAVHIFAESYNLQVKTPKSLKNEVLAKCDIIVLVSYGLILPKNIIEHPKIACINIHPSLLPRWRGAAPIQHAILAGDSKTGVSIIKMVEALDAGDIYLQKEITIEDGENYKSLHKRLSKLGSDMLIEVLDKIESIAPVPQSEIGITYASKLPNSIELDINKSAIEINRQINAIGSVKAKIFGINVKILKAKIAEFCNNTNKIEAIDIKDGELRIFCKDGVLIPEIIQPEGKKEMNVKSFFNGYLKK